VIRVDVVTCGRSGFIVAVETTDSKPGAGYDWDQSGTYSVVGKVYRTSPDGEPEDWKAWLLPVAGQSTPRGQSTDAAQAASPERLRDRLQKRADEKGPWWSPSDGRCPEVLEHDGRQSRCETASVVPHYVHRAEGGIEWMTEEDFQRETEPGGEAA
jgi:hypothetical protein